MMDGIPLGSNLQPAVQSQKSKEFSMAASAQGSGCSASTSTASRLKTCALAMFHFIAGSV